MIKALVDFAHGGVREGSIEVIETGVSTTSKLFLEILFQLRANGSISNKVKAHGPPPLLKVELIEGHAEVAPGKEVLLHAESSAIKDMEGPSSGDWGPKPLKRIHIDLVGIEGSHPFESLLEAGSGHQHMGEESFLDLLVDHPVKARALGNPSDLEMQLGLYLLEVMLEVGIIVGMEVGDEEEPDIWIFLVKEPGELWVEPDEFAVKDDEIVVTGLEFGGVNGKVEGYFNFGVEG